MERVSLCSGFAYVLSLHEKQTHLFCDKTKNKFC